MKISLVAVVKGHFSTLRNLDEDRMSRMDLFVFYVFPALIGLFCWYFCVVISASVYSASISVFAIFSALLFSVQVAMYGVFRTDRRKRDDMILEREEVETAENARKLLREINANVSYLIFVSGLAVTTILVCLAADIPKSAEAGALISIYLHFALTVAMVLKRAHEVFDAEYSKPLKIGSKDPQDD